MDIRVANRYAEALFSLAKDQNKVEEWQQEVSQIKEIFKQNPALTEVFAYVKITASEKNELITKAFSSFDRQIVNFLHLLVDKGRINYLTEIADVFNKQCNDFRGIDQGIVYSPYPLEPEQLKILEESIGKKLKKKVELKYRLDKTLILGIRVDIGGRVIDGSAKNEIKRLKDTLMEAR